jgi:hypothetical protein
MFSHLITATTAIAEYPQRLFAHNILIKKTYTNLLAILKKLSNKLTLMQTA